jgi:hypothetical protein
VDFSLTRFAVLICLAGATAAHADLFSPGPLAKPHQNLEGLSNCTQCHVAGQQLAPQTCLNCHTELKGRWEKSAGYHGRLPAEKKNACESCHHEHQGRDFALVSWGSGGKKAFDHKLSGWPLEGAHAKAECGDCHDTRRIDEGPILQMLKKQPGRETYLGLPTKCAACHFDEHRGQVGQDCKSCHVEKAFDPPVGFNHDQTDYPLRGQHKKVECKGCHPSLKDPEGKTEFPPAKHESYLKFSPLDFRACTDCHKDPHEGRFGQRCQSCHVVEGWKIVRDGRKDREFHDKTKFPLKGEHEDVECRLCHGPFPGKKAVFKGLPSASCADCHFDAHLGQMTIARKDGRTQCDTCHSVEGFLPPRFDAETHKKTEYPLEGAHRAVGCRACHTAAASVLDKIPAATKRTMTVQKRKPLFSPRTFQFAKLKTDRCESCHKDVHAGQFKAACSSCHAAETFKLPKFDHSKTRYPLEGGHAEVPCTGCHGADQTGVVRYAPLPMTCEGCHADEHLGQFAQGKKPAECGKCHQVKDWKSLLFEHRPPFTEYLLDGAHAKVKCERCHARVKVGRASVARYKPLPSACEGCHSDFHQGAFEGFTPP